MQVETAKQEQLETTLTNRQLEVLLLEKPIYFPKKSLLLQIRLL